MTIDIKTLAWIGRHEWRSPSVIRPRQLARLLEAGLVVQELGRVRITENGRQRLSLEVYRPASSA